MFVSERITPKHDLGGFRCGRPDLDHWLVQAAVDADRAGTARTFVRSDAGRVIAYLSLCPHEVRRESLPGSLAKGGPNAIPAILLARLALDQRLHGEGLGEQLLVDALERATAAVTAAGGRVIVVDAIDDRAARFYERYGFQPCPDLPLRLVRKASDVARSLDPAASTTRIAK